MDRARKAIRTENQAIIVEGYLDVIAVHQAGYRNVVSPMGTALTERQLSLLKRFTRRLVLALDSDAAGDKATMRGLQLARQTLDRETDPVFDARGLLGHEARLQADIRVTTLPEGMDPDDIVNRDPQEWERILADAKPIVMHVMEALAQSQDLDDPKVKDDIAAQVLPLISDIPSAIERDTYRQRLARLLRVDERALVVGQRRVRRRPTRRMFRASEGFEVPAPHVDSRIASAAGTHGLEAHALGVLLRRPDLLYKVDRRLQEEGLSRLAVEDFQHADHQTANQQANACLDERTRARCLFVASSRVQNQRYGPGQSQQGQWQCDHVSVQIAIEEGEERKFGDRLHFARFKIDGSGRVPKPVSRVNGRYLVG